MTAIDQSTRARARQLRAAMTPQERRLWRELRDLNHRLGCNFRRKAPVGHVITDFADYGRRLAIAITGSDAGEDEVWLRGKGFAVLRFGKDEVDGNLDGVMQRVLDALDIGAKSQRRDV